MKTPHLDAMQARVDALASFTLSDGGLPVATTRALNSAEDVPTLLAVARAAFTFAEEMADYCSPHGVATDYAERLRERLTDALGSQP